MRLKRLRFLNLIYVIGCGCGLNAGAIECWGQEESELNMNKERLRIDGIPAVIYGNKADKVYIFIHGKSGYKEEADDFAKIICEKGYQVLAADLPGHGERTQEMADFVPWKVVPELQSMMDYVKCQWNSISVRANSIGAYFCMLAYRDENLDKALFVSPVLDMVQLIQNMMVWADVTEKELQEKKSIKTNFGETLNWNYFEYANENQIVSWKIPTFILYAGQDNLTSRKTVDAFIEKHGCKLTVMEDGEHWFHTPEQIAALEQWTKENS